MRKEESLGELRVPNRPTQREGKGEEAEKGCCHDQTDDMMINIHDSLCCRWLLILLRIVFFFALATREYFNIKDDITLFSMAFMYLTNFGFTITLIFYASCMWDLLFNQLCCRLIPNLRNTVSIFFQIALCFEVPITIIYWTALYQPEEEEVTKTTDLIKDIGVHGFPLFCLLVDFLFNVLPFIHRHLIIALVAAVFYLGINLVYTLVVRPIYTIIDWKSGMSYVYVIVAIAAVAIVHCIGQLIWYKCKKPRYEAQALKISDSPV